MTRLTWPYLALPLGAGAVCIPGANHNLATPAPAAAEAFVACVGRVLEGALEET